MDELQISRAGRRKSEEEREVLRDELEHRVKNLIATVQAIARQTFPRAGNESAMDIFSQRLAAIGEANKILKQNNWTSMSLHALALASVAPFVGACEQRCRFDGPNIIIPGNISLAIGMALHELCTNAIKYGALSNDTGTVSIRWKIDQLPFEDRFVLIWKETVGPPFC